MLRTLGPLRVHPLNLGGNVFGWSADAGQSFAVLDAYVAAGGNFVDTADTYMIEGGESETIIGDWMAQRGNRDDVVVATKVAKKKDRRGLAPDNVARAAEESLARLRTDHVDLYYAHEDDESVPLRDSLGAFDALVRAGTIRAYGLSNFSGPRIAEAIAVADEAGYARPVALQNHYNLVERDYEGPERDAASDAGLAMLPFFSLARGFLTGKYREGVDVESQRAEGARIYLDRPEGPRVLAALDEIAEAHGVSDAAVALAWLRDRPTVVAPIASARTVEQLEQILPMATLELSDEEAKRLEDASAAAS